jgi:hypothetical protein
MSDDYLRNHSDRRAMNLSVAAPARWACHLELIEDRPAWMVNVG